MIPDDKKPQFAVPMPTHKVEQDRQGVWTYVDYHGEPHFGDTVCVSLWNDTDDRTSVHLHLGAESMVTAGVLMGALILRVSNPRQYHTASLSVPNEDDIDFHIIWVESAVSMMTPDGERSVKTDLPILMRQNTISGSPGYPSTRRCR